MKHEWKKQEKLMYLPNDDEPESFGKMVEFCKVRGLTRTQLTHREIYITDARKTAVEKLKTILRFSVKEKKQMHKFI